MSHSMNPNVSSRRHFLRQMGALSTLGSVAAPVALNLAASGAAAAAIPADYRALVCVFLYGGNDAFNTVLATDSSSWANYSAVRNQAPDSIALLAPAAYFIEWVRSAGIAPASPG